MVYNRVYFEAFKEYLDGFLDYPDMDLEERMDTCMALPDMTEEDYLKIVDTISKVKIKDYDLFREEFGPFGTTTKKTYTIA